MARAIETPPLVDDTTSAALTPALLLQELDLAVVRLVLAHRLQHTKQQPSSLPIAPTITPIEDDFHGLAQRTLADSLFSRHKLFHRLGGLVVTQNYDSRLTVVGVRGQQNQSSSCCWYNALHSISTPLPTMKTAEELYHLDRQRSMRFYSKHRERLLHKAQLRYKAKKDETIHCAVCNKTIRAVSWRGHQSSKSHKQRQSSADHSAPEPTIETIVFDTST